MFTNRPDFNSYVDWDGDGFYCTESQISDGLNLVPTPLTWASIDTSADAGSSASVVDRVTAYGTKALRITTDSGLNAGGHFGRDSGGTVDDIPVTNGQTYRAMCWMRGISGYSGVNAVLVIRNAAGTQLAASVVQPLTADWTLFTVTFTVSGGDTYIRFKPQKDNNAAAVTFEATGFMLTSGTGIPSGFNVGATSNRFDRITDYVMAMRWHLGMREPYQIMSDESRLELTLNNADKRFSPENANGVLYGSLLPMRKVKIVSDTQGTMYSGYIDRYAPVMGQYSGPYTCRVEAVSSKRFMEETDLNLPLQKNKRADQVIQTIFGYVVTPPSDDSSDLYDLDTGLTTYAYVGDNWDRFTNAWDAVASLVNAERGKFFFARNGKATFYNRERFQTNVTPVATFTNTMDDLDYGYGDLIVNECRVSYYARSISATTGEILWSLDSPITLRGGDSREIRARFAAAEGQVVGGDNLQTPSTGAATLAFSTGSATLSAFTDEARSATFTLTNDSATRDCVVSTIIIKGRKITSWNAQEITQRSASSQNTYGLRVEVIDESLLTDSDFARNLAGYEIRQKKTPRGLARSVTVKNRDAAMLAQMLTRMIGDRISIEEAQTDHEQEYFITGEAHDWRAGGQEYSVRWTLEPAANFDAWLLGITGRAEIGVATVIGL